MARLPPRTWRNRDEQDLTIASLAAALLLGTFQAQASNALNNGGLNGLTTNGSGLNSGSLNGRSANGMARLDARLHLSITAVELPSAR